MTAALRWRSFPAQGRANGRSCSRSGATAVTRKSALTRVSADARTEHLVKCEGATGSLAIIASGHGPSHPRSLHHGSRLPAMSRRGAARLVILVRGQACRQSNAGRSLHQLPDCDPGRSVQDCGSAERGEKVLSSIRLCRRIRSISSSPTRRFGRAQLERAHSGSRAPSLDRSNLGGREPRVPARRNLFPRMSMAHRGSVL